MLQFRLEVSAETPDSIDAIWALTEEPASPAPGPVTIAGR
jgi:hypothetical protein